MANAGQSASMKRFGVYELDLVSGELRKHGVRLRLQRQPFQILAVLVEHPGEVVTREELIRRLWPDGVHVDFDRGLNAAVTRLRQVLSDSADQPSYIETIPGVGYRFIAPINGPVEIPTPSASGEFSRRPKRPGWLWPVLMLFFLGLAAVSITLALKHSIAHSSLATAPIRVTSDTGLTTTPD